jgi:YVTN family beta-propeller protein
VSTRHTLGLALLAVLALAVAQPADAGRRRGGGGAGTHEAPGKQNFASPQSNPIAISPDGAWVYVANTTSNSVTVIQTQFNNPRKTVEVGLEPVGLALRPGTNELWVANHVSDTVSVVDVTNPTGTSCCPVRHTLQSFDANGFPELDEPVGIAFRPDGTKAYVALSSRNRVAVLDAATKTLTGFLNLTAQEPRALAVGSNNLLYVASFESMNKTQASFCQAFGDFTVGSPCSLGLQELGYFVTDPNLPGTVKNIVVDSVPPGPGPFGTVAPDRDVFAFDTGTDQQVGVASAVGTLLYGLVVDSGGTAFLTQTDARNQVNGDHGLNLIDLGNRMFDNELAAVTCTTGGCTLGPVASVEPASPTQATALATPFAIALSGDETTLVATAAASSRVFTVSRADVLDGGSLTVLDALDLGTVAGGDFGQQFPRGLALRSDAAGAPLTAYVLNTLENTVSVVDVSVPTSLVELTQIAVGNDPTPTAVRRGRMAFENAFASDSGTFACGSCHPDGNTDQLLWRIGGECDVAIGCDGNHEPRLTMPVRGLKHTVPLHWDGVLGDPFGGGNGAVGFNGNGGTDCTLGDADGDHDCFLDLVNGSLAGVMCDQSGTCPSGGNQLSAQEKDDMATFLASVSYPPARSRRVDDTVTTSADAVLIGSGPGCPGGGDCVASALEGFKDFFTNQGGSVSNPDTCADANAGCHVLPLTNSTNSITLAGFEAPTMRGLTDRFVQFSMGPTASRDILELADAGINLPEFGISAQPLESPIKWSSGANGFREVTTFGVAFMAFQGVYGTRPLNTFQMFEEASTGYSGALGRQLTLNATTTLPANLPATEALLADLEAADELDLVNLRGTGIRSGVIVTVSYLAATDNYQVGGSTLTRGDLILEASAGATTATLTGQLPINVGAAGFPQPLLGTPPCSPSCTGVTGDPPLPSLSSSGSSDPPAFNVSGTDVRTDALLYLDGQPVGGTIGCSSSTPPFCNNGTISIDLTVRPPAGLHLLQVQNPKGMLSNELPMCVGSATNCN